MADSKNILPSILFWITSWFTIWLIPLSHQFVSTRRASSRNIIKSLITFHWFHHRLVLTFLMKLCINRRSSSRRSSSIWSKKQSMMTAATLLQCNCRKFSMKTSSSLWEKLWNKDSFNKLKNVECGSTKWKIPASVWVFLLTFTIEINVKLFGMSVIVRMLDGSKTE